MKLLKSSRTTSDGGKSFDLLSQSSRKPTVITIPTYEEVEANVPKPEYKSPHPKPLKPIPPPEPIPGATVLLRACATRLDKERWHSSSNPKSAPTWEEYIKMYNHSTSSVIRSSVRRDVGNLVKKRITTPQTSDKSYSNSSQEIQENDYCDEHSDRGSRDGDEPPNKRKILIYDTNHTEISNSCDDNVETIEQINDTEHEIIRKKTQLTITSDMNFFERLKILAPEAAAVYHEMEVIEESIDTDQPNTRRVKNPYDKKAWFGKDTEKFYKLVAKWGYNYSKIADLTGRT
ncbi:12009_t:CDS:2, partial [Cetraspora pellucida]